MVDMKLALLAQLIMVTITPIVPKPPVCDSSRPPSYPWHNTWHQSFMEYCNSNHFLGQWVSYYRQCQGDRLHYFRCKQGPATGRYLQFCSLTGYWNNPAQAYFYKWCPNHGFIAGVVSVYDPVTSDRMLRLRCCRIWGYKPGQGWKQYLRTLNCLSVIYQNVFGQTLLNYRVPHSYTLTGVGSYYSSIFKDRRWLFQICKMQN
ncbi:hypothetical protein ACROYT_G022972 [Oculina patagonica]